MAPESIANCASVTASVSSRGYNEFEFLLLVYFGMELETERTSNDSLVLDFQRWMFTSICLLDYKEQGLQLVESSRWNVFDHRASTDTSGSTSRPRTRLCVFIRKSSIKLRALK